MMAQSGGDWRKEFGILKAYAQSCDGIRVTRQGLSVSQERKELFYDLTERCQRSLGLRVLGGLGEKGAELAGKCQEMRSRLIGGTNLKEFRLASTLENFMEEPELTMAKPAFGIVLDGLCQESSLQEMEERAEKQVISFSRDLMRNAYEAWLYYGIVAALEPIHFYAVHSVDTVEAQAVETETIAAGFQVTSPGRRMPEALFVTKDKRIFAIKSEVAEELDFYGIRPGKCQDFSAGGNTMDQLAHRVLLVYRLESEKRVPLLADRERLYLLPNDLMCEFLLPEEMERPLPAAQFAGRIKTVRSRRKVQVLTYDGRGEFPEALMQDPIMDSVERREIGGDEGRLKEIARLL